MISALFLTHNWQYCTVQDWWITLNFNNNAFGNVRRDQSNFFDSRVYGSELQKPDFVKLAVSFGAQAYRANSPAELKTYLEKALVDSEHGPVVIEVLCERGSDRRSSSYCLLTTGGRS